MADGEDRNTSPLDQAAELAGRSLGRAAGVVDALKERHPDPVAEVNDVLRTGREGATRLAAQVKKRSTAAAKKAKASVKRVRSTASRARRKTAKAISRARRSTRKGVTRAKALVKRARKTASRRPKRARR